MAKTYSTPRRYDLATLMAVVVGYMVLFGLMRLCGFGPVWFFFVAGLVTCVAIAQALLLKGRQPRMASMVAGSAYLCVVVTCVVVYLYVGPSIGEILSVWLLVGMLFGGLLGYVSGVCVGGVFLVADYLRRGLGWQPLELDDADGGDFAATTSGDEVVQENDLANKIPEETHPLDRDRQVG